MLIDLEPELPILHIIHREFDELRSIMALTLVVDYSSSLRAKARLRAFNLEGVEERKRETSTVQEGKDVGSRVFLLPLEG